MLPAYNTIPLRRPLLALLLGILFAYQFPDWNILWVSLGGIISIVLLIIYQYIPLKQKLRLYWLAGLLVWGIFFAMGNFAATQKLQLFSKNKLSQLENTTQTFAVVLQQNPTRKTKNFVSIANIVALKSQDQYKTTSGKLLLRIDTALENQHHFTEKDTLVLQTKINCIQNFPNSSFDVAQYYSRQFISYQANIKSQNLISIHQNNAFGTSAFLARSRSWILQKLRSNIPDKNNLSLAEALLIGYKDDLDKNLENAYRDAGIIHIIAISGMHLILLYELLKWTFFLFLKNISVRKWIQLACLVAIWLFALLTGGGPSVIRAATMLTFLVLGEIIYRNNNSLNGLVASAFLLLLFRPEWIWNVGFWLSYMAVLGILLFYKPILQLPDFDNPLVRKIWEGNAVTLAAQILTLPILMYCFGKIPLYFLFTNLLMVPLSSIILYCIIGLLLFSWNGFLAHVLGSFTDMLIGWMNAFVRYVAQFPLANISVSIDFFQMMVLYGIIGVVLYLLEKKRISKLSIS